MKKVFALMAICLLLTGMFFAGGCGKSEAPPGGDTGSGEDRPEGGGETPQGEKDLPTIESFLPKGENKHYIYEGEGNEFASYDVYMDYTSKARVQLRINNGGTMTVKVLAVSEDALAQVLLMGEVYYRENFLNKDKSREVLLCTPIEENTSWTLEDGRKRTITGTSVKIQTPAGEFDCIEVTTESENGTTQDYYAKDVGLVKSVFRSEGAEVTSTLSAIEEDAPYKQTIRFFYPGTDGETLYYVDKEVEFRTNDITAEKLTEAYKEVPEDAVAVFSENTAIKSLAMGDNGAVYVDLNQAFITEVNAGSGFEDLILRSLANTFGTYYNTDRVLLTVEGKPYSSGHFQFAEGEYLKQDLENAVPLEPSQP